MRHRQAAPRTRGRQHPPAATCPRTATYGSISALDMPKAGRGVRCRSSIRSALPPHAPDRPWMPCMAITSRPSRSGKRPKTRRPTLLYHRLQQHRHIQASVRLRFRLSPGARGRRDDRSKTGGLALFRNFRRRRQPAGAAPHAVDRQRAARVRRRAGPQLPDHGRRPDRAFSARAARPHR